MNSYIEKSGIKMTLNKAFRTPQRSENTHLKTGITTVKQVFKNKQIIEVIGVTADRYASKI